MINRLIEAFRRLACSFIRWARTPQIKVFVVPGGRRPVRKTDGSVGYDASVRAIVSRQIADPCDTYLRKMLFDFFHNGEVDHHIRRIGDRWVYRLEPGHKVFVALGVVIEMPFPLFYKVEARSGLEIKLDITLANHAPIDSDFRGEACALVHNISKEPFDIEYGMQIAQIIYYDGIIPTEEIVRRYKDLSVTKRGSKGFGPTGL